VQAYSQCILPCYENVCDLYLQQKHLLAPVGVFEHPMVMACNACGVDLKADTNESIAEIFNRFVSFALNYKALSRRWEAGDTSILQPAETNCAGLMFFVSLAMVMNTGKKEMVIDACT
jgi:hypothetical protein